MSSNHSFAPASGEDKQKDRNLGADSPEGFHSFRTEHERAERLLAFDGEPKIVGQWFAEARAMARAYLALERERDAISSALGEPCAECGHIDWRSG